MSPHAELPDRIYHLAIVGEWNEATDADAPYRRSTLGKSLAEEGFIHCSMVDQVQMIGDLVYRGRDDVLLLTIEVARVDSDIRVEPVGDGGEMFPHIYGPLPLDAVTQAHPIPLGADGRLVVQPLLDETG